MSAPLRRISRFWMEGGHLTNPAPEPKIPHYYGLDTSTQTVHRFRSITELVDWIMAGDGRERVASNHAMVKKYRNADLWTDET